MFTKICYFEFSAKNYMKCYDILLSVWHKVFNISKRHKGERLVRYRLVLRNDYDKRKVEKRVCANT